MAGTPVTNFGKVQLSLGYNSAAVSVVLVSGHGSRLPLTFPFPLAWWNATDYADPADDPDREIVMVTARTTDTLTIARGAEGTSASNKNITGKTYKMVLSITKAMWDGIFTNSLTQSMRGLSLMSHPDSDKAAAQVYLSHADAIVMQDGQEVQAWDDLSASLAASGAGGLDTGTEQASTWYQVHGIYNGSTKNLLLHRAKDYFLDEDVTTGEDASQGIRSAVDNSTVRVSQGFKVDTAGLMEFIDVKILKTGTPTGNIWFTVEATSGGVPSNTPLATSDKYDVARLLTTATVVRFPFRIPATLSAATQYHIVVYGDWAVSATNFVSWRMDGSAATYANGSKALFDSDTSTWTNDTDDDMYLKVYITRNDTSVTMPSGYTQRALIGWAYNDSGSNLKHFFQKDHEVFCGYDDSWQIGALTNTAPSVIDLAAFVPPTDAMVDLQVYGSATANFCFGELSSTDLDATAVNERIGSLRNYNAGGTVTTAASLKIEPYQGMMFVIATGTGNPYIATFTW